MPTAFKPAKQSVVEALALTRRGRLAAFTSADYQRFCVYVLLLVGIGLRLYHYFYNRSFFIDELFLNVNLIKMSFWELATRPLEYQQKAPIGYLWSVKVLSGVFGYSQQSLRLFSLLGGIGSLFVFLPVAGHFLKSWGRVAAIATLAFSSPCIYHAVEAKQYSTELLTAVVALWLYTRYHAKTDWGSMGAWGLAGSVLLWFSFSLIFVLASMAVALCTAALLRRQWQSLGRYAIPAVLWLLSFGVQYVLFVGKYHQSGWLIDYFDRIHDAFMPLSASFPANAWWVIHKLYVLLLDPLGLLLEVDGRLAGLHNSPLKYFIKMGWLHGFCVGAGVVVLFRKDKVQLAVLALPVVLALAASGARVFPFHERFVLFLAPLLILFAARGLEQLAGWLTHRPRWFFGLMLLFFAPTVLTAGRQLAAPTLMMNAEYNREVILYVNDRFREGDVVYVFWNMSQAYEYYKLAYPLRYTAVQGGYVKNISRNAAEYLHHLAPDFRHFEGHRRLWYIYDKTNFGAIGDWVGRPAWYHRQGFYPPEFVGQRLAAFGKPVLTYRISSYNAVLYELKPPPTGAGSQGPSLPAQKASAGGKAHR